MRLTAAHGGIASFQTLVVWFGCAAAARFLHDNGVKIAELLPYNRLAGAKYASVGRQYKPSFDENVLPHARTDVFRSFGVEPKVLWGDHVD